MHLQKRQHCKKQPREKKCVANTFKRAGAIELATPEIIAATIYV
jgi:hypothetical protein